MFAIVWWLGIFAAAVVAISMAAILAAVVSELRYWRREDPIELEPTPGLRPVERDTPVDIIALHELFGWVAPDDVIEDTIERCIAHILGEATPERADQ